MSETGRVKERKREILRFRATRKTKKKNKKRKKICIFNCEHIPISPFDASRYGYGIRVDESHRASK
jgi:hypothetical protein